MIEGIVLAAGRSRRAGVFKPAHRHRERPLLLHAVDSLVPFCHRVTVVAGHRHEEVARIVAGRPDLRVVVNRDHRRGMFSSVQVGVLATAIQARGLFVLPADCPGVEASVVLSLLDSFEAHDRTRAIVPIHDGRGGHPVLLPGRARRAVAHATADTTLREIIRDLDPVRLPVASPSVLRDIDTPADIAALTEEANA